MVGVNIMSKGMSDDWRTMREEKLGGLCWAYDDDERKRLYIAIQEITTIWGSQQK